jgi:hypothetical protein
VQQNQEPNITRVESNEQGGEGDDGEDPNPVDLERGHTMSQQKRKKS